VFGPRWPVILSDDEGLGLFQHAAQAGQILIADAPFTPQRA